MSKSFAKNDFRLISAKREVRNLRRAWRGVVAISETAFPSAEKNARGKRSTTEHRKTVINRTVWK